MISDFINLNKELKIPMYLQIYKEIKRAIENGSLKENEKIPSVRKLSADFEISKTTVENAYNLLCGEGYIINRPQKGYFVEKGLYIKEVSDLSDNTDKPVKTIYEYDFSGKGIDSECSNIKEWKKYVKNILNKEYLLNTYSENQGEEDLRQILAKYAFTTRGVKTAPDNIIVGSGSQTLIYILCGMLGTKKHVAIEKNTFPQAEQVFKDFDYRISYISSDREGVSANELSEIRPDILLINPNHNRKNGVGISAKRKIEIINKAKENNCLIIEDDYNGELRYKSHAMASIQSMARGESVYIGSFSKILLPSVRISYMVIPNSLLKKYEKIKQNYNQTTSKVEQLALCEYIKEGKLEKHLRRSRRYYKQKSEFMQILLKKHFDSFTLNETSMYFEINDNISIKEIKMHGINPMHTSSDNALRLNFSQISFDKIEKGIEQLSKYKNFK